MRLRIPWLLDIESVTKADDVAELAVHPSTDRALEVRGPLFNRFVLRRMLSAFQTDGNPLPGFRGRNDMPRSMEQERLRRSLDKLSNEKNFDRALLAPAIGFVAGGYGKLDDAMAGICLVLARLFDQKAEDGKQLWDNAQIVATSVRPLSSRGLMHRMLGRDATARRQILSAVGKNPNGLHAIAITTANIAETLKKMRALNDEIRRGATKNPQSPERFWLLVRTAPETLFRHVKATLSLPTSGSILTRDALILLHARKAQASEPVLGYEFMSAGWSACPAASYVVALCWCIWTAAQDEAAGGTSA